MFLLMNEAFMMNGQIKKWGNSLSVRVPKKFAKKLNIQNGSNIQMDLKNGSLVITKEPTELECMLSKINEQNKHNQMFDDNTIGKEAW
jgi:antitoxin MazE